MINRYAIRCPSDGARCYYFDAVATRRCRAMRHAAAYDAMFTFADSAIMRRRDTRDASVIVCWRLICRRRAIRRVAVCRRPPLSPRCFSPFACCCRFRVSPPSFRRHLLIAISFSPLRHAFAPLCHMLRHALRRHFAAAAIIFASRFSPRHVYRCCFFTRARFFAIFAEPPLHFHAVYAERHAFAAARLFRRLSPMPPLPLLADPFRCRR